MVYMITGLTNYPLFQYNICKYPPCQNYLAWIFIQKKETTMPHFILLSPGLTYAKIGATIQPRKRYKYLHTIYPFNLYMVIPKESIPTQNLTCVIDDWYIINKEMESTIKQYLLTKETIVITPSGEVTITRTTYNTLALIHTLTVDLTIPTRNKTRDQIQEMLEVVIAKDTSNPNLIAYLREHGIPTIE